MKTLTLTIVFVAITAAAPANAQQARPQGAVRQTVQSTPPALPIENKALVRLKCHFGTASPKVCAKIGFANQSLESRT